MCAPFLGDGDISWPDNVSMGARPLISRRELSAFAAVGVSPSRLIREGGDVAIICYIWDMMSDRFGSMVRSASEVRRTFPERKPEE